MSTKIRITKPGIHGLPLTDENPSGEYPIGHELTIDGEIPAGWLEKVEIISGKPKADAVAITNDEPNDTDGKGKIEAQTEDANNGEVGHDPGNPGDPAPKPDAPRRGRPAKAD